MATFFQSNKKSYPKIIPMERDRLSAGIIRANVLVEWLKTKDIRTVQYMAVHRYASSTERYNVMNLQALKDSLNKYHPMKRKLEVTNCDLKIKNNKFALINKKVTGVIPEETVISKIYIVRGMKVMMDKDLAELYDIETKRLKEQVRRNIDRFPEDFMFEMTKEELEDWRSQFATSNKEIMGLRVAPFVFTEHGVLMLSSVLNSQRAIKVNIQIMRVFTKMKEMILTNKDILLKLEKVEKKMTSYDEDIAVLFSYLKQLLKSEDQKIEQTSRKRIGYKKNDE